ncbi:MAG: extracellular solute-binding protein [Alphaproteobacteria bacterium]
MSSAKAITSLGAVVALALGLGFAAPALAAELPKATQDILKKLKLDAGILAGLDQELKFPKSWIAKAKKEGRLKYIGTIGLEEWSSFSAPFKARYPYIKFGYIRSNRFGRVTKPLIAYREGRVITDIIAAIGSQVKEYKRLGALADLRDIPNFKNVVEGMRAKDGLWVGERLKYWCMAYNTKLVKKRDLPKTWDDLVTNPAWHNKNLGLANRPNNWLLALWNHQGEKWGRDFMAGLFGTSNPQLRKEGIRAMVSLTTAGEFHASIPATSYRVGTYADKGGPVAWHCPDPATATISELVMLNNSPSPYSAKIFINWFLSKEGQITQYYATEASPVHKDLQDKGLLRFAGQLVGKKVALRHPHLLETIYPTVLKAWDKHWQSAGGPMAPKGAMRKVRVSLSKIKRGGRRLFFKVKGKEHKVKISRSRSRIIIKGEDSDRGKLKVGMNCTVTYPGNGGEAKVVDCK